jgi:hypothetical protein
MWAIIGYLFDKIGREISVVPEVLAVAVDYAVPFQQEMLLVANVPLQSIG